MADVATDISKMKVADLKKELKNRGKSTVGNKTELTERLQAALIEGDNTLLDESVLNDDIMDDDELNEELDDEVHHDSDFNHEDVVLKTPPDSIKSKSPEPSSQPTDANTKKVILKRKLNIVVSPDAPSTDEVSTPTPLEKTRKFTITSPTAAATDDRTITISNTDKTNEDDKKVVKLSQLTAKERLELRAKKFGAPIATESLKAARSERFGLTPITTTATDAKTESNTNSSVKNGSSSVANVDVLKKRAERFGGSVSKEMNKIENLEKLQKRSERFGKSDENKAAVSGSSVTTSNEQMAEKARQRLERFKTTA
ncbi:SAP domain-containing ribonucleoprotein [Bradysia coprophila]|uniref:SAP domain-containing ribonucleoprotein n=1 Tax=Bradysia coprophila TaxID=38358 RepID=UPI00187DB04C|nr:SAP domain-containing ribonucleoprotein [Bradysia coprophila]XP_037040868.1 SAP domain-containing ribonucleoprotein [Bradysia coprophila]